MKLLFTLGLALSAALLFNIQPMLGKLLLPKVGGSPSVWNVAMACFQLLLLGGYLLAHLLSRLSPRNHGIAYLACLALAALTLPIALPAGWSPGATPVSSIIAVILTSVGPAFVALALSAPTLQRLFANSSHRQASDPYFLYAASNLGSFIGLLAYPVLLEPYMGISEQARLWQRLFFVLVVAAAACVWLLRGATQRPAPLSAAGRIPLRTVATWVLLAFIPSSLTLGVNTVITNEISPTPLLWVATLGIYLMSFIVAFAWSGQRLLKISDSSTIIALLALATTLYFANTNFGLITTIAHLAVLASIGLSCHTRLALLRPEPRQLTSFYLWLSFGGALGGSFNALLAPVLFNTTAEYYLVIVLAILTMLSFPLWVRSIAYAGIAAMILMPNQSHIFVGRSFFGIYSIDEAKSDDGQVTMRMLNHGSTLHGIQIVTPSPSLIPTTYYAPTTPIGMLWRQMQPQTAALVGLGSGTLNCYARPDQQLHFVEIDPLMVDIAEDYFSYLRDCPTPRISVGDGRLVLAADPQRYDLIVLDAFSSDAIPVHLLTQEAIEEYLRHLNPGGILAFHISSRLFDLEPPLAASAAALKLTARLGHNQIKELDDSSLTAPSIWLVMSGDEKRLMELTADPALWRMAQARPDFRVWTDDYSSLLPVLKFLNHLAPLHDTPAPR